jgi:hypothetical protein
MYSLGEFSDLKIEKRTISYGGEEFARNRI